MKVGCVGMEWVAVLCVLSAFSVLVEGQGEFRQPPSDNYNLPLDPYQAASSFVMVCSYVDGTTSFEFTWTKDGANFQPSGGGVGNSVQATVPVLNGEYDASLEGTYTCRVVLGGATEGSRNVIVTLPVLFSVNETTVVVRAGEAVRVNCSQTGYIRTQWRWRRNGVDLSTAPSERVYTELSRRSKVGTATSNTVPNHQSLFLHLRHARVMDNGEYTCVTETDTQTVTVDVQPPDNVRFNPNGPVSYEMPRPFENASVSYVDFLYNGSEGSGGMLTGGVGQLVDGVKGTAALDTDEGRFPWVGWATTLQQIIFEFDRLQCFGSVTVHAYLNSPGVTWFGTVEVSISQNKEQWSTFSFGMDGLQGPQDIIIPTQMNDGVVVEGRYVRLIFSDTQGSGPMLISEVSFNSTADPIIEPEPSPPLPTPTPLSTGLLVGVTVAVVALVVGGLTTVSVALCFVVKKKQKQLAMAQRGNYSVDDYAYPSTEMEKNPAYVAMTTDVSVRLESDEVIATEHPYESPADMGRVEDYSYPSMKMEKNPAYVAMRTDESLPPQGDDGIAAEHPYESPADTGSLRDTAASSPSDEHTLGSAYI